MIGFEREPTIQVGLITGAQSARITLHGRFSVNDSFTFPAGDYTVTLAGGLIRIAGAVTLAATALKISPANLDACRITVHDVTIGIDFHWQRKEAQQVQGALRLKADARGLMLVNQLPLEAYLVSVISSEMSASCPPELLRAHAIVSRSWLLAQLQQSANKPQTPRAGQAAADNPAADDMVEAAAGRRPPAERAEIIRWYDRESHTSFDVCADDHCQRYQGITKAFSEAAFDAVHDTRGKALVWQDEICDARYSKSCGGMTEVFGAAWEDRDVAYLAAVYDGDDPDDITAYSQPLTVEANAEQWIEASPPAFCNTDASQLLERILPGFDQATLDFYRWRVTYGNDELREIINARLGIDVGRIKAIEPLERGQSGRLVKLRIAGQLRTLTIGKELEIRRTFSRSHLYSSAFVVRAEGDSASDYPPAFTLLGAGWGHGVGLCQIGAAVMAERGYAHGAILAHYFRGAALRALY